MSTASSENFPASQAALEIAARLIGGDNIAPEPIEQYSEHINPDLWHALNSRAGRLMSEHRFTDAFRGWELTRQVGEKIGDPRGVAVGMLGMGTIHGRRGDYVKAVACLEEGLSIAQEIHDELNIEVALNNLGIVAKRQGEYEEAIGYYRRALSLAEERGWSAKAARTLNNIGNVHMLRGSYRDALHYFQRSLELKEATQQIADIPSTLLSISDVYERIGDIDLALEYAHRGERVNVVLGSQANPAVLEDLGRLYADQHRYDVAQHYYQQAHTAYEMAGSQADLARALLGRAQMHRARMDIDGAMSDLRRSLAIRELINDRHGTAETRVEIAATLLLQGKPTCALDTATEAVRIAREIGARETLWRARLMEGKSQEMLGESSSAGEAFAEAVELIDELRGDTAGAEDLRQRFLEGRVAPFQHLAQLLIAEGRVPEALRIAEMAKARVLLDVLGAGRADVRLLSSEERERERQLDYEITTTHARVRAEEAREVPDEQVLAQLSQSLGEKRAAKAEFHAKLYSAHPALRLSRGDAEPGSFEDAAAILDDTKTAILEYLVMPDATYLFVVSRDETRRCSVSCFDIKLNEHDLTEETSRFRHSLATRDLDFGEAACDLYRRLVAPAGDELRGKTNLIIVPDGPLWDVPFLALAPAPKRYLVEDAAISVTPSIAVLRENRAKRRQSAAVPTLVAFGDSSAGQLRKLETVYGAQHCEIFMGREASKERFMSVARTATVLHLGTHGVLDHNSPMYSFLQLTGDTQANDTHDARLEAWEIMNLNLDVEVTVLAACETARGRIGAGEGVIGLSWAFFLAGSARTVVSLWKVDAASTADLMEGFHQQLHTQFVRTPLRPAVAASLRAAILRLMKDRRYRHPFYWAGFNVIGDGS